MARKIKIDLYSTLQSIDLYRTLIMNNFDRTMDLTPVQRDILTALINIHRVEGRAVKGEEIAELIDRNPGTIRNQMQSLKALNLVEGVPGPKGGYKATGSAYEALNIEVTGEVVTVPVIRNGVVVEGATASEIVFNKVMHSHQCDGVVRVIGNIRDFNVGDEIEVGPTPVNKLYIRGKMTGRDDTMSRLILHITEMISVPKVPIKGIARRAQRIPPTPHYRKRRAFWCTTASPRRLWTTAHLD